MTALPYDERLERLLTTAAGVFAAKGYHPTTMRDLARATGMSLAGIYYYVSGKDELLFRVQERCFTRVLDGARSAVRGTTDPVDRVERFITHHVTFFADHMDEMKVLSHEADALGPERKATIDGLKRRYVDLLLGLLDQLPSDGGAVRVDTRVAVYALFGMMNWIYTWYDTHGPISPTVLAEQLTEVFLRGVAPATTTAIHGGR